MRCGEAEGARASCSLNVLMGGLERSLEERVGASARGERRKSSVRAGRESLLREFRSGRESGENARVRSRGMALDGTRAALNDGLLG